MSNYQVKLLIVLESLKTFKIYNRKKNLISQMSVDINTKHDPNT